MNTNQEQSGQNQEKPRRSFGAMCAAGLLGGLAALVPIASGIAVFLDPLRRKSKSNFVRVARLESVPDDGLPRRFPVLADRVDAWNRYADEPIGAVYLRRLKGEATVEVLNASCPHAGCFVEFQQKKNRFQCPCHDSSFQPDGTRNHPESCPSPRSLDSLQVNPAKLQEGEVWIEFKNFRSGMTEKIEE